MQNKQNFIEKLQDVLMPIGTKIAAQRHLSAVSGGIMMTIPLTLLSAFINLIANPPVTQEMVDAGGFASMFKFWLDFKNLYYNQIMVPYNMTMGVFSLVAVIGISYALAKSYKMKAISTTVISTTMFLMIAAPSSPEGIINTAFLGSNGLFAAIIVGLLSVEITRFVENKHWVIKMPDSVPPNVSEPFIAIIPAFFNLVIWYGLSLLSMNTMGVLIPGVVQQILTPLFGAIVNPVTMILMIMFACILWLFGIHGTNILFAGLMPVLMQYGMANATAYNSVIAAGGSLVQASEALKLYPTAMFSWMAIGGTGGTLGLCILMMKSKSAQLSTIGKLAIVPGLCGINEPVIFGVPIVLNVTLAIPFIMVPVISCILGYALTYFGILDIGHNVVMALLPTGVGAFLATGSWKNSLFEYCLIPLQIVMWYPFFKVYEKQLIEQEANYTKESM